MCSKDLIKEVLEDQLELSYFETVIEEISSYSDLKELAQEIYECELNFKHADKTTSQRIFNYGEILDKLKYLIRDTV